jgi:hypothetical protein
LVVLVTIKPDNGSHRGELMREYLPAECAVVHSQYEWLYYCGKIWDRVRNNTFLFVEGKRNATQTSL